MNNKMPSGYKPLKKLTICSNTLTGGGNLVAIGDEIPLIIGKGSTPQIWLKAIADSQTKELIPIVQRNKSLHPAIRVTVKSNQVVILIAGDIILSVKATSTDVVIVDKIDLRPLGINLFGNSSALTVGGGTFSNNSMSGGGTLIGLG